MLKPFARSFADRIYRTDFFVVCSAEKDFYRQLLKLIRHTSFSKTEAKNIVSDIAKHTIKECNGRCWRLEVKHESTTYGLIVIWIRPGVDVSVVTHEAWHAAFWVFQERGITFDGASSSWHNGADEPMAYYLQWLVRSILDVKGMR